MSTFINKHKIFYEPKRSNLFRIHILPKRIYKDSGIYDKVSAFDVYTDSVSTPSYGTNVVTKAYKGGTTLNFSTTRNDTKQITITFRDDYEGNIERFLTAWRTLQNDDFGIYSSKNSFSCDIVLESLRGDGIKIHTQLFIGCIIETMDTQEYSYQEGEYVRIPVTFRYDQSIHDFDAFLVESLKSSGLTSTGLGINNVMPQSIGKTITQSSYGRGDLDNSRPEPTTPTSFGYADALETLTRFAYGSGPPFSFNPFQ